MERPLLNDDWIPLNKREHLGIFHMLGIAFGNLGPRLLFVMVQQLFTPLATNFNIGSLAQTFILLYGSLAGFFCAPLVGVSSDSCMFKYGRRRIFIVLGTLFMIIGLLLMSFSQSLGKAFTGGGDPLKAQQSIFIIAYMIAITAGNIANAPTRTVCSDVCPPKQQSLMANLCSIFSAFGGILVNLIGCLKLYKYTPLQQEQFLLIISVSFIIISVCSTTFCAKEEPLKEKKPRFNPFVKIFNAIKTVPKAFYLAAIPYMLIQMSMFQYNFYFSHFMGKVIFGGDNSQSADPEQKQKYQDGLAWALLCNIVRFGTQFLYGFVNAKICQLIGMRLTSIIGYFLLASGFLSFFWVNNKYFYLVIPSLVGIGFAVAASVPFAIISLIAPQNDLGAYLGLLMMCMVIGEQLSNFVIGRLIGLIWPNNPRNMIGVSSVIAYIAAIIAFWTIEPKVANDENNQIDNK